MQARQPFLVYRDRIGVASEISFLRRQYIGFTRLQPVWTGRTLLADAHLVGDRVLLIGDPLQRLLFRHFGYAPRVDIADLAPVLHAQFARGGALALPLSRVLKLRMVVTLHGGDVSKRKNWQGTLLARRWPALVREAACFVCVSHSVAEIAAAKGVPAAKLQVLPIGVEMPEHRSAEGPACWLFVGRFVEKKGIAVLEAAMRRLRAEGDTTPLVCVGDGPLRPVLEALARDVVGITLTGWLPPDGVRAWMTQAYALIVPSMTASDGDAEGLPSVIPEAMAQGCAVIGSDQGGIAEAIEHGRTGLLVAPGNPAQLAAAMRRMIDDPSLRRRLAAAGFEQAATQFNARLQSAKLEALLLSE